MLVRAAARKYDSNEVFMQEGIRLRVLESAKWAEVLHKSKSMLWIRLGRRVKVNLLTIARFNRWNNDCKISRHIFHCLSWLSVKNDEPYIRRSLAEGLPDTRRNTTGLSRPSATFFSRTYESEWIDILKEVHSSCNGVKISKGCQKIKKIDLKKAKSVSNHTRPEWCLLLT